MSYQHLLKFIETKRSEGATDEAITLILREKAWREELIVAALAGNEQPPEIQTGSQTQSSTLDNRLVRSFDMLKDRLSVIATINFTGVFAVFCAVFIGVGIFIASTGVAAVPDFKNMGIEEFIRTIRGGGLGFLIGLILTIVSIAYSYTALTAVITSKEAMTVREALRAGITYFPSFVWVNVLTFLVIVCGFLLVILPGFYAMIVTVFASIVIFNEDLRGVAALARSHEVFKSDPWVITGNILSVVIITSLMSSAVNVVSPTASILLDLFILTPFEIIFFVLLFRDKVSEMKK